MVAEGVQTPGELATLRALGCELGQGFFIAQPCGEGGIDNLGDLVSLM